MLFYLSLVWDSSDLRKTETARVLQRRFQAHARDWRIAVDQPGLTVWDYSEGVTIEQPYVLRGGRGVVLGRLFEREYAERTDTHEVTPASVTFDEQRSSQAIASAGRYLVDRYWGHYVAFLRDANTGSTWVVRDPSGGVACQWTRVRDIDVYFVRLEDCDRLEPLSFSINRHYLLGYLVYSNVCVRETALNGIETVLAGECIAHDGQERTRSFYWNPLEVATTEAVEDPAEAVRLVRQYARASVHAWSSCFDGIELHLSGGLDSSIVLSCVTDAPNRPRVACLNFFDAGPDSDERRFARCAAARAGFELTERQPAPAFSLAALRNLPRALSPYPCVYNVDAARESARRMRAQNLSAQFTGDSGDELFLRISPLPTVVDYVWRHGLRARAAAIAMDDAALEGLSIWDVLRLTAAYGLLKRPWSLRNFGTRDRYPSMLPSIKLEAWRDESIWHPLYRGTPDLPPGKLCHAYSLTFACTRGHVPGVPEDAPVYVAPLRSQPLMEVSLRIPVYVLKIGGRDRAIARQAFAGDVPQEIILRKTKSHGDTYMRAVLAHNAGLVRELLLDGYLVRERIVNRSRLEQVLSGEPTRIKTGLMEILVYLSVEAWARSWTEAHRAAA